MRIYTIMQPTQNQIQAQGFTQIVSMYAKATR